MPPPSLFKRRPLPTPQACDDVDLQRCFGPFHLTLLGLTNTFRCLLLVVFVVVADVTGPSACVTFLLGGLLSVCYGLCFVDLAAHHPSAGSTYTYTFAALGEVVAFIVGWTALCDLLLQAALLAKAAAAAADLLTAGSISDFLLRHGGALGGRAFGNATAGPPPILSEAFDPLAAALLLLLGLLLLASTRFSVAASGALSCLLLAAIFAVHTACFVVGSSGRFARAFLAHGPDGFRHALALSPLCFGFFEAIAVSSEEALSPARDVPLASGITLGLSTGLLAFAAAAAGFMPPRGAATLAAAFEEANHPALFLFTAAITFAAAGAAAFLSLFLASRYVFAMARGGSLPAALTRRLQFSGAPWAAVMVCCVSAAAAALLLHEKLLADVCNVGAAIVILAISTSLLLIRYLPDDSGDLPLRPSLRRHFEARRWSDWLWHQSFFKACLVLMIVSFMIGLFFLVHLKVPFIGSLFTAAGVAAFGVLWLYEPRREDGRFRARGLPLLCGTSALISAALVLEMTTAAMFRLFVLTFLGLVLFTAQKLTSKRAEEYHSLEGENGTDLAAFERNDTVRKTL